MNSLRLPLLLSLAAALACGTTDVATPAPVAASTITGKVVLAGVPDASGLSLTAIGPVIGSAVTAADGSYSFVHLQAGAYTVTAAVADSREQVLAVSVTVAASQSAAAPDLAFTVLGSLTGKAQKASATDHSGIEVGVLGLGVTALTDAAGNYRLTGVPLGAQTVSASAPGYQTAAKAVTAGRGDTAVGALSLAAATGAATTSISGKVVLGVDDQSGVLVTAAGPTRASATTARDGSYTFPQLAQGTYFVTARVGDSVEGDQTVLVTAGASAAHAADLAFTLVGSVTGTAQRVGSGSADQSGILVGLLGAALTAVTDAGGAYRFDGVRLGGHALSASAAGYTSAGVTVTAARGTTAAPALSLQPATPATSKLSVSVVGSGQVLSAPAGLACANACSANFPEGSAVVLYAEPSPGYLFGGWSVAACTQPFCPVTVSADTQVTATFLLEPISVTIIGPGHGSVQFLGASGGATRLLPAADPGYTFVGWRGACTGRGDCTISGGKVQAAFTGAFYYAENPDFAVNGISLSGTGQQQLSTVAPLSSNWYAVDADGLNLAYTSNLRPDFSGTGRDNLWVVDLVTRQARALTQYADTVSVARGMPALFSPDGQTLAFFSDQVPTSTVEAVLPDGNSWMGNNLFTIKRDGTGLKAVTSFLNGELLLLEYPFNGPNTRAFAWSPDGKQLAFVARVPADGYANVFTAGPDGANLTQVTRFASSTFSGDPQPYSLTWSPDGKKLAFVCNLGPIQTLGGSDFDYSSVSNLCTVALADGKVSLLTTDTSTASVANALYAPTGNAIVYLEPDGEMNTYTLSSVSDDGTGQQQLYQQRGDRLSSPVWHVDGTTLLFESYAPVNGSNTGSHIWMLQPGGEGYLAQPVTSAPYTNDFTYNDNNDD